MLQTLKTGLWSGLKTTWTLGKIIFPITLVITILQFTPILPWIIKIVTPLMKLIGLSGDAAIPIVLGNFLNLYAGIAGILSVDLTLKEVFIIAVMLSFAHNLFIESSVAVKVGVKIWVMILVRVGLAVLSAIIINLCWHGGGQHVHFGTFAPEQEKIIGVWPIILNGMEKALLGVLKLAEIVIPLMIGIQILKDLQLLKLFSRWMAPVTRLLGMKENTSTTLAAGLFFGLAYGAGVMIQAVKEDGVSKKDATLAFIFLCGCHAVVEDTLIFVPLGIPVIYLLLVRLITAIILTFIVGLIWNRIDLSKSTPSTLEG